MRSRTSASKAVVGRSSSNGDAVAPRTASEDRVDKGRVRSGLEIPRKLLHSSIGVIAIVTWLSHPDVSNLIRYASIALAVIVSADLLRFEVAAFERVYERWLGYFMRESERHRVNGTIYYLVGVLICLTFYPRDLACLSIVILSLCDTSASVFGRLFGKYTPRLPFSGTLFGAKKSLAGTIAAVLTGTLASYLFWSIYASRGDEGDLSWLPGRVASTWTGAKSQAPTFLPRLPCPNSTLPLVTLSIVNGLTAGVAEAFDVFGLDDNLSLPVLFGLGAWAVMRIIG